MKLNAAAYRDWDLMPIVIDVDAVCVLLNCCDVTVHKKIKDGTFKAGKLGKNWRIDRDSVKAFILGTEGEGGK